MLLRPNEEEYEKAFSRYISLVPEGNFFDHLQAQTEQNRNYFGRLSEEAANYRYAPKKWSLKEVLGHVMDAERIFTCRALCIARGEQQPLPGFDEQEYARVAGYDQLPLQKVLQQYDAIRLSTRLLLEQLPDSAWTTKEHRTRNRFLFVRWPTSSPDMNATIWALLLNDTDNLLSGISHVIEIRLSSWFRIHDCGKIWRKIVGISKEGERESEGQL
jgi:uncharacterized damage-inducible protein DinB